MRNCKFLDEIFAYVCTFRCNLQIDHRHHEYGLCGHL